MNENGPYPALNECLRNNEATLIESWEQALALNERFLVFRSKGSVTPVLRGMLQEVLEALTRQSSDSVASPRPRQGGVDERAVLNEIHVFRLGERLLADMVLSRLQVSDADWLIIRHRINRAFHDVVLCRSSSSCEACAHHMREEMTKVAGHELKLREAFHT